MNYLPMMSEDEIKYICSLIPLQESILYFKRYPKDFAKIMPGFRATSLRHHEQVSAVLFKRHREPFISSFIEKHVSRWLEEIHREISLIVDNGECKESAWLQTLPFCFFVDDIGIFFKLTEEEISSENLTLLKLSIRRIKDLDIECKKLEDLMSKKEQELVRLKDEKKHIQTELDISRTKLIERSGEIKLLERMNADLEKLSGVVRANERDIEVLENELQERDKTILQLKAEWSTTLSEHIQLESSIREELREQEAAKLIEQAASAKPRCPQDIDEFKDYLGYNLENLGIRTSDEYYSLLKNYLCEILFTGKPIIVSRNTGFSLMKCLSNALVSSLPVATLVFAPGISIEVIDEFLSAKNRIMCLDNFIGYFDEMILTTICERHKDKILFLTVAYDKTLRYVPEEFLKYCHYLNIGRIEAFNQACELTEDPSTVEEVESSNIYIKPDAVWSPLLREIFDEFAVCSGLSVYKSQLVSNEATMCQLLAFDILPYCADVLDSMPFAISERLNKYAGNSGRCRYKELFRRWYS